MHRFAVALNLPEDFFLPFTRHPISALRANHYPPLAVAPSAGQLRAGAHSDYGTLTILMQNSGNDGLEIQNRNGEWVGAPPLEETFVINLGNIMQIWSNGRFSSTPHRVINRSNRDRFSIPLFVNPSADIGIRPLIDFDSNHSTTFNYGTYQRDLWRQTFPVAKIPA